MKTKVLLADDHKIIRDGLRSLLEKESNIEVVGEAENGLSAVRLSKELKPDVVIMDIGMPDLNGIEATRQIKTEIPSTKVIALSMHADRHFVSGMLTAGASGYVLKGAAYEELSKAIETVMNGRVFTSPKVTEIIMGDYVRQLVQPEEDTDTPLTPRERQVLQLIAEGKNTKEIAKKLCVSANTIDTHRHNIMKKLDIHSVAGLTKYAIREGITSVD